jgi:hypothetical protein
VRFLSEFLSALIYTDRNFSYQDLMIQRERNGRHPSLTSDASLVLAQFWALQETERDQLLSILVASHPLTLIVGGKREANGAGLTRVFSSYDVTEILGDLVGRQHDSATDDPH